MIDAVDFAILSSQQLDTLGQIQSTYTVLHTRRLFIFGIQLRYISCIANFDDDFDDPRCADQVSFTQVAPIATHSNIRQDMAVSVSITVLFLYILTS